MLDLAGRFPLRLTGLPRLPSSPGLFPHMQFRQVVLPPARALALAVIVFAAGCTEKPSGPSGPNVDPDPDTDAGVSYAADIVPLFHTYGCINCHGTIAENRFSVSTYESLFEPGFQAEERGMLPVKAGDPDSSYVYWKMVGQGPAGESINGFRMPVIGAYMSAADLTLFRTWVAEGALDN